MSITPTLQKDTMYTKIFVGGLPYHTTDETLKKFFEQFGEIDEAVVITDRQSGKSRGYGFVTMAEKEHADHACKEPNPIIDGRKANVNLAYLGAKPRGNITAGFPFPLKTGLHSLLPAAYGHYGYPQMYYAAPYIPTASTHSMLALQQQQQQQQHHHHTNISPTTCQYIDYTGTPYMNAVNAANTQLSASYDATLQYATALNHGYTYALPQQLAAVHPSQLYAPQPQIQERMQ